MIKKDNTRFWFFAIIIGIAVCITAIARLFPHLPNFTPVGALALFVGTYFVNKKLAIIVPLLCLLVSDALLHVNYLQGIREYPGFYEGMWVTYLAFAFMVGIGMLMYKRVSALKVLGAALGGSLVFFLVTNFAVWMTYADKSLASLLTCYEIAIPFFRGTLAANLVYSAVFYGVFEWAKNRYPALNTVEA